MFSSTGLPTAKSLPKKETITFGTFLESPTGREICVIEGLTINLLRKVICNRLVELR